jgi:hypothetical protein
MSALFLAINLPGCGPDTHDPDEMADHLVAQIRGSGRGTPVDQRIMVSGIPAPQWLTPETLANLRAQSATPVHQSPHPLAVDKCDFVDGLPAECRALLAHVIVCEPCRRGMVNIIQSSPGYPDLFGRNGGDR